MTSRLPNLRLSTEKAPGPIRTMEPLTAIAKIAANEFASRFVLGAGIHESAVASTPVQTITAVIGVKTPIMSATPLASPSEPAIQFDNTASPRIDM